MSEFQHKLDPVTFEVLRHRMWAINDEGAATLRMVSGSPVATEILDFNTSLMNAQGDSVLIGVYIAAHGITQQFIVKKILKEYLENPGVEEGDMFVCSDPYSGALHQNDMTVVAPIFADGALVAWTGATIHLIDVGGMAFGSQACIGADSIYQEATPIPPLKIIERGRVRKDIEEDMLIRGRTRDLNALDFRAMVAGCTVAQRRMKELFDRYGADTVKLAMEETIDYTETMLCARLRELPDGTWRHTCYIDYADGKENILYPGKVAMTKTGERLIFDFAGTAPQAPAVFNSSYSGTLSATMISVLVNLCYDIPWSPAGALRVMELKVEPGTLLNPVWPAGCCKATTGGAYMTTHLTSMPIARMLLASDKYQDHAMAMWMGGNPTQELNGIDQRGQPFGGTILDVFAGGAGARTFKDGIDTGGMTRSLSCAVSNIETYEFRYPLLYLYRRQQPDSGGAGRHRGGASVNTMYTVHGAERIDTVLHTFGAQQPEATGLSGGYPASSCSYVINRGSEIEALFREGRIPSELEEVKGSVEVQPPLIITDLKRGDIYRCTTSGGGGMGDPLDRDPEAVRRDVEHLVVSPKAAKTLYGVVVDPKTFQLNASQTEKAKKAMRERRKEGKVIAKGPGPSGAVRTRIQPAGLALDLVMLESGRKAYRCRCGELLAWGHENYKERASCVEGPIQDAGPLANPFRIGGDRFVYRKFSCPQCATLLEGEIAVRGAAYEWDTQIA
jgi:N-methylhydantoinase B